MRWGEQSGKGASDRPSLEANASDARSLRWVRPLHAIVAMFGTGDRGARHCSISGGWHCGRQ